MKLGNLTDIKVGINSSRITASNREPQLYSSDDLQVDLGSGVTTINSTHYNINDDTCIGDVVTSLVGNQLTTVISEINQGKTLNQNFAKISFDYNQIDPYYLCYLLNIDTDVQKQKETLKQGTNVPKLKPQMLREIDITLPTLSEQAKIGRIYFLALQRQKLAQQLATQEFNITLELLKKIQKN